MPAYQNTLPCMVCIPQKHVANVTYTYPLGHVTRLYNHRRLQWLQGWHVPRAIVQAASWRDARRLLHGVRSGAIDGFVDNYIAGHFSSIAYIIAVPKAWLMRLHPKNSPKRGCRRRMTCCVERLLTLVCISAGAVLLVIQLRHLLILDHSPERLGKLA